MKNEFKNKISTVNEIFFAKEILFWGNKGI